MSADVPVVCSGKQPTSLLQQCTDLVASHLDLVESFCGLPSLIGEKIFSVGCMTDRFRSDVQYSTLAVNLFAAAYGDEFLSKLNLSGQHLGLNYCLEQLLLFTHLTELDMSDCGLGDNHEIIAHFEFLPKLEVVSMRDNVLSNVGVQKMTAPYRMFSRGPAGLKLIDFTGNADISRECLKYLAKFQHLLTVMFSETNGNNKSQTHGGWRLSDHGYQRPAVSTVGWAKVLIDRWMYEATSKSRSRPDRPKSTTGLFSIRKHHDLEMLEAHVCQTGHEFRNICHNFVARRINIPSDNRHSHDGTTRLPVHHDNMDGMDEIQDLYKTTSQLQSGNIPSHSDSIFEGLDLSNKSTQNKISVKTSSSDPWKHRPSSVRNKTSHSSQSIKSKHLSTQGTWTSTKGLFKFGMTSQSAFKLSSEKVGASGTFLVYPRNEKCKENSPVESKMLKNKFTSIKQQNRKRKKIVLIKNTSAVFGDSNVVAERPQEPQKTDISSKDDVYLSEPAAKKKCLKPSLFNSLNDYI